ncbi:MAG: GH3 auxin-responsive promoter family protein, partial [Dehalococcoidales bacterium]|nr:GH3 auxin-responsive promoter family protein [Dehalococcoidales bacterium]
MSPSEKIWERGNRKEIWDRYCSFLDLNIDEFMAMQDKLLMEHVKLLAGCELGRALMDGNIPRSPDEFRKTIPLTDYPFYEPFLANKREDALPVKPKYWVCTSGISGVRKWVPMTASHYEALMDLAMGMMAISTATGRRKFSAKAGDKFFAAAPSPPYFSGFMVKYACEECGFRLIPPMDEEYEISDLPSRSARGFKMALESGIDLIFALPSVMVRVG